MQGKIEIIGILFSLTLKLKSGGLISYFRLFIRQAYTQVAPPKKLPYVLTIACGVLNRNPGDFVQNLLAYSDLSFSSSQ